MTKKENVKNKNLVKLLLDKALLKLYTFRMETIETYDNVRILNDEPEFIVCDKSNVSAEFFILCEENSGEIVNKNVYDCKICGMSVLNWVVRACISQPKILKTESEDDIIGVIRPYIDTSVKYSVVLFANTPLLNRMHISDMLAFVDRRGMNVCKLKHGYVFRNDYIKDNDSIYSVDEYDFASNDFFEIKTNEDLSYATEILTKKILDYHKKNGVYFENEKNLSVDANTEIGCGAEISSGDILTNGTKIGKEVKIAKNAIISGSKIGDESKIGLGAIIIDSIVKNSSFIGEGVIIKNSVISNNSKIECASRILSSSIRKGTLLQENVVVDSSRIGENCIIGNHTKVLGIDGNTFIESNCQIGANCTIENGLISQNSNIQSSSVIKGKVED